MASRWIRAALRSGHCRRRSPRSSSMRCALPGFSAASESPAARHETRNLPMLRIEYVYWLCGALFLAAGAFDLASRRYASAAFWAILSACFFGGDAIEAAAAAGNALPAQLGGIGVIALALIAGSGALKRRPSSDDDLPQRRASAERLGNRLFLPALAIPLVTLALVLVLPYLKE